MDYEKFMDEQIREMKQRKIDVFRQIMRLGKIVAATGLFTVAVLRLAGFESFGFNAAVGPLSAALTLYLYGSIGIKALEKDE